MRPDVIPDPPLARFLFASPSSAPLWLVVRLYLGWQWFMAGWTKVGSPAWTGANAGAALQGFVRGALERAAGPNPAVQPWYANFLESVILPNAALFARLVAWGEVLVGLGLILGALTGVAAFFGTFMNFSFMLAGTAGANPLMFALGGLVVLAWKVAGFWGLDRWLLPVLGTPWRPGRMFR